MPTPQNSFFSGFNLNSLLLLIVIILLTLSLRDAAPEFKYNAVRLDAAKVTHDVEWAARMGDGYGESVCIPRGWEYVGFLCPDGEGGTWVLVRQPAE